MTDLIGILAVPVVVVVWLATALLTRLARPPARPHELAAAQG